MLNALTKLSGRSAVCLNPFTPDFLWSFADLTAQIFAAILDQKLSFEMAGQHKEVETTVDFARRNSIVSWLSGWLELSQAERENFPVESAKWFSDFRYLTRSC